MQPDQYPAPQNPPIPPGQPQHNPPPVPPPPGRPPGAKRKISKKIWLSISIVFILLVSAGAFLWFAKRDTEPKTFEELLDSHREQIQGTGTPAADNEDIKYIVDALDLKDCEFLTIGPSGSADCTYVGDSVDPKYYEEGNIYIEMEGEDTPLFSPEEELDIACSSRSSDRYLRAGRLLILVSIYESAIPDERFLEWIEEAPTIPSRSEYSDLTSYKEAYERYEERLKELEATYADDTDYLIENRNEALLGIEKEILEQLDDKYDFDRLIDACY